MLILWIQRSNNGERPNNHEVDKESQSQHNEDMKKFSINHPEIETAHPDDIISSDGQILAPVHMARLSKNSQN